MPTIIPTSPENAEELRVALLEAAGDQPWRVGTTTHGPTVAFTVDDELFASADLPENTVDADRDDEADDEDQADDRDPHKVADEVAAATVPVVADDLDTAHVPEAAPAAATEAPVVAETPAPAARPARKAAAKKAAPAAQPATS